MLFLRGLYRINRQYRSSVCFFQLVSWSQSEIVIKEGEGKRHYHFSDTVGANFVDGKKIQWTAILDLGTNMGS